MEKHRIGEVLVAEGYVTEPAVQRALGFQRSSGERVRIGSILLNWELLSEESLLAGLAKLHRRPGVSWAALRDAPAAVVRLLPGSHAARLGAIPYSDERRLLRVAFVNPSNIAAVDEVSALTGRSVAPGVATEARLLQAHQKFYGRHVPMEYRTLLQKLERRPPSSEVSPPSPPGPTSAPVPFDVAPAAAADPVGPGKAWKSDAPDAPRPVERDAAPRAARIDLPEFPSMSFPAGRRRFSGEDSLSDWVGETISAFTDGEPAGPDPSSPAGVSDPALFQRGNPAPTPETIDFREDDLPPTNAFRGRIRRRDSERQLPHEHTREMPSTIPPFRRATDPRMLFERARPVVAPGLDDEDEAVAGMWRPAPPEESADEAPMARSGQELAELILDGPLLLLPRVMLLGCGSDGVFGWSGRGNGLSARVVSSVRVPSSEVSIFSVVKDSGVPHFGAVDRTEWPRALEDLLGRVPVDCAVFPVRVLDSVTAFVYADRAGAPMRYEDFAMVARASASAAGVLSRFLVQPSRDATS